jgi:hypothetical protein
MKINLTEASKFNCASVYPAVKPLLAKPNLEARPNAEGRSAVLNHNGNHYGLLGYISTLKDNQRIVEMGTRFGFSALAMSINETNHVISYDIVERGQSLIVRPNLEFRLCNLLAAENNHLMLESDILFVDIAPHNGIDEKQITDYLLAQNYKGITLWHDIHDGSKKQPPRTMWKWWTELPPTLRKLDLTAATLGAEAAPGVGLVDFSNTVEIVR